MISSEEHELYIDTIKKLQEQDTTISDWASKAFADKDFLTVFLKVLNEVTPNSDKDILNVSEAISEEQFREKCYAIFMNAIKGCK